MTVLAFLLLNWVPGHSCQSHRDLGPIEQSKPETPFVYLAAKSRSSGNHGPVKIELEDEVSIDEQIKNLYEAGKYAQAIPFARKRLEQEEQELGPDAPEVASALNTLAWLLQAQGDYPNARQMFERSLKIREAVLGPEHLDVATSLNNLASLLSFQGDRESARPLYERALQINEKVLGSDHPDVATSLNNLAVLLDSEGKRAESIPLYERALTITEKALGPDHPDLAINLNNLASMLGAAGQTERAKPLLERALSIREKALGAAHPDVAESLNNLAMVNKSQGNLAVARQLLEKALKVYESALGPDHLDVATTLNNLGQIAWQEHDLPHARASFLKAGAIVDRYVQQVVPTLSLAEQRAYLEVKVPDQMSILLSSCTEAESLQQAYTLVLRWKGLLIDSLRRQTAVSKLGEEEKFRGDVERLQNLRSELAGWYQQAGLMPYKSWRQKNDALTSEKELLERQLARALKPGALEDILAGSDMSRFLSFMHPDEALVDIYRYDLIGLSGKQGQHYACVVVSPQAEARLVDLGESGNIDSKLSNWRHDVLVRSEAQERWQELVNAIWKPVASILPSSVSKVWLCPDAELSRVPWHLVPGALDHTSGVLISELDSPRELAHLRSCVEPATQRKVTLLLAGGIDFNKGAGKGSTSAGGLNLPLLPGTMEEVKGLKALAEKHGFGVTMLSGIQATKAAILTDLPCFGFCHLATHGFFFNESPRGLSSEHHATSVDVDKDSGVLRNPLVESGIALAGANVHQMGSTEQAGLLTAEEFVGLDLSHCELMTLSACETGRGQEVTGQGVMGLRGSVMAAGTKSMLMSLWKVPDTPTLKLMEYFYTNLWDKKLPKVHSLRLAQEAVRNEPYERFKNPINWAGWVLVGEGW
ncbi:MAG: tetratricopeptide repeat protein [Candidatus Melainabacteria bacterium]|nr:tetratricopeptide repeat protein [Candidatus Melainabacteria bacterium]